MDLSLERYFSDAVRSYNSVSQQVRSATERWASDNLYCPRCGKILTPFPTNTPVYDFYCNHLGLSYKIISDIEIDNFQLKSLKSFPYSNFPKQIIGAEYVKTFTSLVESRFPSLFLLHYSRKMLEVRDILLIHRLSITPRSIIPRNPLSETARRSGWQGSIISLENVPQIGKIPVIRDAKVVPKGVVMHKWMTVEKVMKGTLKQRSWITDIMSIIDGFDSEFTLEDMYYFSNSLSEKHPNNKHIKDKIRQQLQILRDRGYLKFKGSGKYEKTLENY